MGTEEEEKTTLDLWERVCQTDPKFTKEVNRRGGFTAINAQYQLHKATREWGPYGWTWGVKDLEWGEIRDSSGRVIEVTLDATFWYPASTGKNTFSEARFPISCCMAYTPGNDTRKKLLTDLTTKALSKVGFDALIFMGLEGTADYTDNKYVAEPSAVEAPRSAPEATEATRDRKPQADQERPDSADLHHKRAAAIEKALWDQDWIYEPLKFGKFKGESWKHLTEGKLNGDRCNWLEYMSNQDPTTDRNGEPIKPQWIMANLVTQERCRTCLQQYYLETDGVEETPF